MNKTKKSQFLLPVVYIIFFSCSVEQEIEISGHIADLDNLTVYAADDEPESSIELIRETAFGDTDEVILGGVAGILVDADGCVYIGDRDANLIHIYNSDGTYKTRIGREGRGPGEFVYIANMEIGHGLIHVFDSNQLRMTAFSTESHELVYTNHFRFEDEVAGWFSQLFFVLDDGNYLVQFYRALYEVTDEERTQRLYSFSREGQLISDLILELPWGREYMTDPSIPMIAVVPYNGSTHLAGAAGNR